MSRTPNLGLTYTADATINETLTKLDDAVGMLHAAQGAPADGFTLSDPATIGWDDGTGTDTMSVTLTGNAGSLVLSVQGIFQWIINGGQVAILDGNGLQLNGSIAMGDKGGADGTRPGEIAWNGALNALQVWNGSAWLTISAA